MDQAVVSQNKSNILLGKIGNDNEVILNFSKNNEGTHYNINIVICK